MTLSNRAVVKELGKWVCAWENLEGNPNAGESFAHGPKDAPGSCIRGNGEHNMQLLFLDRKGRLIGVVAGFIDAEEMLAELKMLRGLEKRISGLDEGPARTEVKQVHEKALEAFRERKGEDERGEIFARLLGRRWEADRKYSIKKALTDGDLFTPVSLVGRSNTFFGTSSGGKPKKRIGESGEKKRERQ